MLAASALFQVRHLSDLSDCASSIDPVVSDCFCHYRSNANIPLFHVLLAMIGPRNSCIYRTVPKIRHQLYITLSLLLRRGRGISDILPPIVNYLVAHRGAGMDLLLIYLEQKNCRHVHELVEQVYVNNVWNIEMLAMERCRRYNKELID